MNGFLTIAGVTIAGATALVALYAAARNWLWFARRRQSLGDSPVLLAGPLFALLSAGALAQALPELADWKIWMFPVAVCVADPAALPLVVRAWMKRNAGEKPR